MNANNNGLVTSCLVYFNNFPSFTTVNTIYSCSFEISIGYNKIILPQEITVHRGNFIVLEQITGKIAIDTSGNATNSDLIISSGVVSLLNTFSNWRFYLNTLTKFSSYQKTFSIVHSYSSIGQYNLSIFFINTNIKFQQVVSITQCNKNIKLLKFFGIKLKLVKYFKLNFWML